MRSPEGTPLELRIPSTDEIVFQPRNGAVPAELGQSLPQPLIRVPPNNGGIQFDQDHNRRVDICRTEDGVVLAMTLTQTFTSYWPMTATTLSEDLS